MIFSGSGGFSDFDACVRAIASSITGGSFLLSHKVLVYEMNACCILYKLGFPSKQVRGGWIS